MIIFFIDISNKTNHSTSSISIQRVEKIIYGDNSTKRYRNNLRHELELKWIKLLQTPHPLGFNDNIYHEGNISRLPDFDAFSLLDIRKRNNRSHGRRKNGNLKRKNKHVLTLSELSIILKHSGRHMALSRLVTLSKSSLRNLDIEANKFSMIELIDFMMQQFLPCVTLNMLFGHIYTRQKKKRRI